jgi:hypothetical protein
VLDNIARENHAIPAFGPRACLSTPMPLPPYQTTTLFFREFDTPFVKVVVCGNNAHAA